MARAHEPSTLSFGIMNVRLEQSGGLKTVTKMLKMLAGKRAGKFSVTKG